MQWTHWQRLLYGMISLQLSINQNRLLRILAAIDILSGAIFPGLKKC